MLSWGYKLARPALMRMDAERAHRLTVLALRAWPWGADTTPDDRRLKVQALGMNFTNPFGLAAGFDKNAEVPDAMLGLGFGFVEIGTVTPKPQDGNPRPRLFRLIEDRAVINRMGFNNDGVAMVKTRLARRVGRIGIVGVNVGANKDAADRIADYVSGLKELGPLGSYVTINISSPNTPGLRGLQNRDELDRLLDAVMHARASMAVKSPILLKIAPDLDDEACQAIADVALARAIDGLVISNTTIDKPDTLQSQWHGERGGLSGAPLLAPSTEILRKMYALTGGKLTLIGVGGISSGADALTKIKAGANLLQLYSALAFEGPDLITRIKRELLQLIIAQGHADLSALIAAR